MTHYDIDAERALLGGLLLRADAYDLVAPMIDAPDFSLGAHSLLFEVIRELAEAGKPADMVVLTKQLTAMKKLDYIGGATYLVDLVESSPTSANILHHARIVKNLSIRRQYILTLEMALVEAKKPEDGDNDTSDQIEDVQSDLVEIWAPPVEVVDTEQAIERGEGRIRQWSEGVYLTGSSWGNGWLDKKTGGRHPGELVVIGAEQSLGKTILADMVSEMEPTLYFALESDPTEMMSRKLLRHARCDRAYVAGFRDMAPVKESAEIIRKLPPVYYDEEAFTLSQITSRIRYEAKRHGIRHVVIDFFQLIHTSGKGTRTAELQHVGRTLKALCKKLGINLTAVAVINRNPASEKREPTARDLKDCGDLEYIAHQILLLHSKTDENGNRADMTSFLLRKNKNGDVGMKYYWRDGARFRFVDEHEYEEARRIDENNRLELELNQRQREMSE